MAVITTERFASEWLRATRFDPAIELPLLVLHGLAPNLRGMVMQNYVEKFPLGERYAEFRIARQRFLRAVVPSKRDR